MEAGNGGFCWLKVRFVRSCCRAVWRLGSRIFDVWALSEALVKWR